MSIQEANHEYIIFMDIKNIGKMHGKEVVQIYIENNKSSVYKAKRELKGFEKVYIDPDQVVNVMIRLPKDEFKFYDIKQRKWIVEKGDYRILISKNVNDVIQAFDIHLDGEEVKPQKLSYQKEDYDTKDFINIYQKELPKKHIKPRRPFTLSSTLDDVRSTLLGKIVTSYIIKEGMKTTEQMNEEWMKEIARSTLKETPIRMLSLFSAGKFPLPLAEGIVDMINLRFLKGLKKIRKNAKEKAQ